MPTILFIHENFPAQFGGLAAYLSRQGWKVVFASQHPGLSRDEAVQDEDGFHTIGYDRHREPRANGHDYLKGTEAAVLNGQALARRAIELKKAGFRPDIIFAHSGWGSGSFAKAIWPKARLVQYLEWWYQHPGADTLPESPLRGSVADQAAKALVRNLPFLLDFQQADRVISPTNFQAKQFPDYVRDRTAVLHDGVDCDFYRPAKPDDKPFSWDGLPADVPIVTAAMRGLEPMRGFPTFMTAVDRLLRERQDIHVVIAGADGSHYGRPPEKFESWKAKALAEHDLDLSRIHFTGFLPKEDHARLLRRSAVHVYLTRPFVLSWSLIEAMASAAPLVVTDVEPVREAVAGRDRASFVDVRDPDATAASIGWMLDNPGLARAMGARARQLALKTYDTRICHPAIEKELQAMLPKDKRIPAHAAE